MDKYLLHEEYYKSVRGEDGEEPLEALGSPPHTDMGSYLYSAQPSDLADTVSLPRRPRGPAWRPELPTTSRNPEVCQADVEDSHFPGPTYCALDRTAELLAKKLSASEFVQFLLLTGQSHVDVATKCSLLKRSCKKKILQKQVKQIVKTCSTWAEVLQRLERTFRVYKTDLSVCTQTEELPMPFEFPSAARVSEYVCDLEYLFSRINVGSYGPTEPHLWLVSKIPTRTWDDCRTTSQWKSRTHTYDDLVDLLIELALERENDSHMEKFLKRHLGRGGTPTLERGEGKGPKNPAIANKGDGKGRGNLRVMNEVKPETDTPPLFYCKPVHDKGGPCHAPACDHRSGCVLQLPAAKDNSTLKMGKQ